MPPPSRQPDDRETYGVEPGPALPPLPGEVVVRPTAEDVRDVLAADLVAHAKGCVREMGDFHLALSGGSTPEPLYRLLMYDPDARALPWTRTHLWIVDERCVPLDDPRSNFRMIDETIVGHADIPPEQVHPYFPLDETADARYERELHDTLMWRQRGDDRLDFVLLGLGGDGHTASLFPNTDALDEDRRAVRFVETDGADPPRRLTMTYPLLNAARLVAVLVTGAAKAEIVRRVALGHEDARELPIKGIRPARGTLRWYLDAAACGEDPP